MASVLFPSCVEDPGRHVEPVLRTQLVVVLAHQPAVDEDERPVVRGRWSRPRARSADLHRDRHVALPRQVRSNVVRYQPMPGRQAAADQESGSDTDCQLAVRIPGQIPTVVRAEQAGRVQRSAHRVLEVLAALGALQSPGDRRRGAFERGAEQAPRRLLGIGRRRPVDPVLVVARALGEHGHHVVLAGAERRGGERERHLRLSLRRRCPSRGRRRSARPRTRRGCRRPRSG